MYAHPDCPLSVDALRKQVVSFEKVKLTNNELDKNGQVRRLFNLLHSHFWRCRADEIFDYLLAIAIEFYSYHRKSKAKTTHFIASQSIKIVYGARFACKIHVLLNLKH